MATAFKEFAEGWIEPAINGDSWRRQATTGAPLPPDRDKFPIIKRSINQKPSTSASGSDLGLWKRLLLHERFQLSADRTDPNHDAIDAQVEELRKHATEGNEAFSELSAIMALRFCHQLAADHEPAIFLMSNGNLRAVWQNDARDQIGIQFMSDGLFQYVILRDRNGMTLKALGEDNSFYRIKHTVEIQDLMGLWFCGQG